MIESAQNAYIQSGMNLHNLTEIERTLLRMNMKEIVRNLKTDNIKLTNKSINIYSVEPCICKN